MRKILAFILSLATSLAFVFPDVALAQQNDRKVRVSSNYVQMTNPGGEPWSTLSSLTFLFTPLNPEESLCVYVVNNNPTNAHTFTVAAFQSGDTNVADYTHNTGRFNTVSVVGTPSPVAASATTNFYIHSNAAAVVAIQFSGAATQAGNPDTVDVYAVQTTSTACGPVNSATGQQYSLSTPNSGTSATPPIQAISDGLSQSYTSALGSATNPANGFTLIAITANNGTRSVYFDKFTITCSAACQFIMYTSSNNGTGCGTGSANNIKIGSGVASTAAVLSGCGTAPTTTGGGNNVFNGANLTAGQTFVYDLKGFIAPASTTFGLTVTMVNFTGIVSSNITWYEK